jgi:hypothetical protein
MSLLAPVVHSAEITRNQDNFEILNLNGDILDGDAGRLEMLLTHGQPVKGLRLNSPGGQVSAGIKLADVTRKFGLLTFVGNGDRCASIRVLIFAAGVLRGHLSTGAIGVHSVTTYAQGPDGPGAEGTEAMAISTELARLYRFYGTPDSIIGKMVTTPGDQVTWLKTDELTAGGWSMLMDEPQTTGSIQQQTAPIQSNDWTMTCLSQKGSYYPVTLYNNGTIIVRDRQYKVDKSCNASNGSYVAKGRTKYGTYAAVFHDPQPRIVYQDKKTTVVDYCR